MHRFVSPLSVACVLISALVLADRAAAESRPYSSRGTAQFVSPTEFVGSGVSGRTVACSDGRFLRA